jgi:hypothetical protein
VKPLVCRNHLFGYPGALLSGARHLGTASYDLIKGSIHGDPIFTGAYPSFKPMRRVEFFRKKNEPGMGVPPQNGAVVTEPGEDPLAICGDENLGRKFSPYGNNSFIIFRSRKCYNRQPFGKKRHGKQ